MVGFTNNAAVSGSSSATVVPVAVAEIVNVAVQPVVVSGFESTSGLLPTVEVVKAYPSGKVNKAR